MFVEPSLSGRCSLGEEQDIRLDARVRVENAIGQTDDRVEIALLDQALLERRFDALAKEETIG